MTAYSSSFIKRNKSDVERKILHDLTVDVPTKVAYVEAECGTVVTMDRGQRI
jgi:hypothetical protein